MLRLKYFGNVDDGDSWKKLIEEVEEVTDQESQWLNQLTEIVSEQFVERWTKESTKKKKIITEKMGIELFPGSGTHCSFQEENEDVLIRKQKKQKTENNDTMQKQKTGSNNEKKLKQKTGHEKKHKTGKEKKQKTSKEKKQNPKKVIDPIVELTALGLEPPPDMPETFKNCIENLGGTEIRLVIQKFIQVTDLKPSQNRLSMTMIQLRSKFLNEAEKEILENKGVIEAVFVEPCLEVSKLHLGRWLIGQSYAYVFKTEWNHIVSNNADSLKPMAVVQIWSFRVGPESKLGFAMIKVRDGKDGHRIN